MPQPGHEAAAGRAPGTWRGEMPGPGRALWRHKLVISACVVVALGLAVTYLAGRRPAYQATSLVALGEDRAQQTGQADPIPAGELADQLRLIGSRAMAEQLVERLNLHFLPEFQSSSFRNVDGLLDRLSRILADSRTIGPIGREITDEQRAVRLRDNAIETAMARTRAEVVRPMVLGLHFVSEDPQLAAAGANALAELYVQRFSTLPQNTSEDPRARLAGVVERLRASISEAEQELEAQRASVGPGPGQPGEQTLLDWRSELAFWRAERAGVEARLRQAQRALEADADLDAAALGLDAERLAGLQAQEAKLQEALAELSRTYGEQDPQVAELRDELQALQENERGELELIVLRLGDEIEIIRSREATLEARIADLQARAPQGESRGGPAVLEQRLRAERAQLQDHLERLAQLEAQASGPPAAARILAPAVPPDQPMPSRAAAVYGVALAGALLLGSLLAFGLEGMRRLRA